MADKRISQLVDRGTIANNDVVPIVVSGAVTTNKATISSIQTFMQGNLDFGVTSVGITLGSSGTDVSVSGSPITTSGNITINIPSASATARGLVTTGSQTFAGNKTFQSDIVVNNVNIGTGPDTSGSTNFTNTRIGRFALSQNTTGFHNTAVGYGANQNNTTGNNNTSVGLSALGQNTTGNYNTAVGIASLSSNISGLYNTSIGYLALDNSTTASDNTALGSSALVNITTGASNTAIGFGAGSVTNGGFSNTTSANSVYIGNDTRAGLNGNTNEIVIGSGARGQGSNTVTIGNSSTTSNKFFGRVIHADAVNADESATLGQVNTAIGGYVTLATAQTITAQKTFTTSGSGNTINVNHTSGSGHGVEINKAGNGEGLRVTKTSGSGNAVTITGGLLSAQTADFSGLLTGVNARFTQGVALQSDGGTNQLTTLQNTSAVHSGSGGSNTFGFNGNNNIYFSKGLANGGIISWNNAAARTYTLPDADGTIALTSNLGAYLPLTGGTLTGALNGTSASFTGNVKSRSSSISTNSAAGSFASPLFTELKFLGFNDGDRAMIRSWSVDANSVEGTLSFFVNSASNVLTERLNISSTGAATFSSSVTANARSFIKGSAGYLFDIEEQGSNKARFQSFVVSNEVSLIAGYDTTAIPMTFYTGNTERLRIASTGAATFSSSVTATSGVFTTGITLQGAAATSILNTYSVGGTIYGYNGVSGATNSIINGSVLGDLVIRSQNKSILFSTNGGSTSAVTITSTGSVGIGTASPATTLEILGINQGEYLRVGGGTITGRSLTFSSFDSSGLSGVSHRMNVPNTNGQLSFAVGGVDKVNVTNNGLTFNGDTAAANALDDYEEGTWTPVIAAAGGSGSPTYSQRQGWYTKIGRKITITWYIEFQKNTMSGGTMVMSSFPFTLFNGGGYFYPIGSVLLDNLTATLSNIVFQGANNTTQGDFISNNGSTGGHVGLPINNLASGTINLRGTLTYFTA